MADRGREWTPAGQRPLRHGLAFLLSGGTAFAVDATVLELLTALLGVPAIAARVAAIALAMVAGWLMHRTFTFAVATPPNLAEFVRYAGVAWTASARSEEHTSELQSLRHLVCRLLREKNKDT